MVVLSNRHCLNVISRREHAGLPPVPFAEHPSDRPDLAIIRYNNVSVEYVRALIKRQIIGYLVEVPTVFPLLHPDALEQESLYCHLQTLCRERSLFLSTQTGCRCTKS